MPSKVAGEIIALSDRSRSLPRKRKQDPDEEPDTIATPRKASKRVKRDAASNASPSLPVEPNSNRHRSNGADTSRSDLKIHKSKEPVEQQTTTSAKKTSTGKVKVPEPSAIPDGLLSATRKKTSRARVKIETTESVKVQERDEATTLATKKHKKAEAKGPKADTFDKEQEEVADDEKPKKTPRKRKTKEEKDAEAMPLAARTVGLNMFIGAHVSIATGVEKAVTNCVHIGGNAFALFLQSQRKWDNKPLLDENRDAFISMCKEHKYSSTDHVLPHGSYLVNLAQVEQDRATQAYDHFIGDLKRCEALGIKLYNFHPGAAGKGNPTPQAISRISAQLNRALAETTTVTPVLENMAGSGSVIGSRFNDLRDIIAQIKPEFKSRIGVCIDTCHAFAAGYDIRLPETFNRVMQEFDEVVGFKYLKGLHLNDSKAPFNSKKDLHQNIGLGFLGLRAFHNVMNEPRFHNMPLILETPCDKVDPSDPTGKKIIEDKGIWAREIKLLESLINMDPESAKFKNLEAELSEKGKASREKMLQTLAVRDEKAKKRLEKGQKSLINMMGKKKMKGAKDPVLSDEEELSEGNLSE